MPINYEPIISVTDANDEVWFDIINRTITPQNEASIEDVLVQNDSNSRNFGFHIQRYFEDEDLSTKKIRVHYVNSLNQHDIASAHSIEVLGDSQDVLSFKWLISNKVCLESGNMKFGIEFYNDDETYRLFTKSFTANVMEGIDNSDDIPEPEDEWFREYSTRMNNLETDMEDFKKSAENGEFDGVGISTIEQTTMSTEDSGINVITITKTDGETSTVNIKNGSQGLKGDKGSSGVYVGTGDMPKDCNVQIDLSGEAFVVEHSYNPQSINPISAIGVADALANNGIVDTVSGNNILLTDSSNNKLASLKIYGKSTQNGTPTLDAPIDIVSVGNKGDVNVVVRGKNIADIYGFSANGLPNPTSARDLSNIYGTTLSTIENNNTIVITQDAYSDATMPNNYTNGYFNIGFYNKLKEMEQVTISFDVEITNNLSNDNTITFAPNGLSLQSASITNGRFKKTISWKTAGDKQYLEIRIAGKSMIISNIQIEMGNNATEYEPHKKQMLTISLPNGLCGIPVSSDGNYTDTNGQQWICDEIDFKRGVLIKRINTIALNGTELWTSNTNYTYYVRLKDVGYECGLCDKLPSVGVGSLLSLNNNFCATPKYNGVLYCRLKDYMAEDTVEAFKSALSNHPITVLYAVATPIEIPLTEEEIAYYRTLHTNYPNTTIFNSEGVNMEVSYAIDTKLYIDNKFAELQALISER